MASKHASSGLSPIPETGSAGPLLETLQPLPQGGGALGPQFDYPKTLKAVLLFIRLFVPT
jgi:hypothetical protein